MESPTDAIIYIVGNHINLPSATAAEIVSFSNLPEGWDYGDGEPISQLTIEKALGWEQFFFLKGWDTNAGPGTDAEIAVSAILGDARLEVIVETDDAITIAYDLKGTRVLYEPHISTQEAQKRILEIVEQAWNASAYSIQRNLTGSQISGLTQLLETLVDLYPFSALSAFDPLVIRSVLISDDIGNRYQELLETRSYFGDLILPSFQPNIQ